MRSLCKVLAYIELILGIIGSIFISTTFGFKFNYSTLSLERNGTLTFTIFLLSIFSVLVLWTILCAFNKILENQEKILKLLKPLTPQAADNSNRMPIRGIPDELIPKSLLNQPEIQISELSATEQLVSSNMSNKKTGKERIL